jgi:hypothetical protein
MSDKPTLIQVAFLAPASRADVARFASLLFFDLELLEEGDDRLWVTAFSPPRESVRDQPPRERP